MRRLATALLLVALGAASCSPASARLAVHVKAGRLVDAGGRTLQLRGVDRSGSEYACVGDVGDPNGLLGWGFFDGPVDDTAIAAIASWHVNAVRVPLNEDCWLGINHVNPAYGGAAYRAAIAGLVSRLHHHGMYVILDLHANAPGAISAQTFQVLPDAEHSPAFWHSVAGRFRHDPAILFDVFNEPHLGSSTPSGTDWRCLRYGCTLSTVATGTDSHGNEITAPYTWRSASTRSLVRAIRTAGAHQPIMLPGMQWTLDLSRWLQYLPSDPDNQLVASLHTYGPFSDPNAGSCPASCRATVHRIVHGSHPHPVVIGELGESDCRDSYVDFIMSWADREGISYLGWTWDAGGGWTCTGGPTLITSYDGTPTGMGVGFRDHYAARAGQ